MDLIFTSNCHTAAANKIAVNGGEDISTTQWLPETAFALGRKAHFVPIPFSVFRGVTVLLGRKVFQILHLASHVDIDEKRALLDWPPLVYSEESFKIKAQYFQDGKKL